MKKEDRLILAKRKVLQYNSNFEDISGYCKSYWAAIQEAWDSGKIKDDDTNRKVLEKYALGELSFHGFLYDRILRDLNKIVTASK